MDNNNYLNLTPKDLDKYIYRIVSLDRFRQLFESRQNALVSPSLWDDPFENFILKCPVSSELDFHDRYFGQCWTLKAASDAMWRIYSPDNRGVRLRTTIRRLASSLSEHAGEWRSVSAFIGKVQYLNEKKMTAFAQYTWHRADPARLAQTLLVKRPAFSHESEVRLIFFQRDPNLKRESVYMYPIEPDKLFDQAMCDPRLTVEEYMRVRKQIRGIGFRGDILRSLLYAPPPKFTLRVASE